MKLKDHKKWLMYSQILITLLVFINSYGILGGELKPDSSGYIDVNQVNLYFEIYGKGTTLLYLHGGLSSSLDFEKYIPEFSKHYKIIMIDRRGHGRSYDNDEPYSYDSMAEDIQAGLNVLKIDSVDVIGWSDGGVVGYHLASKFPTRVKKLIAVGANYLVQGMTETTIEWITSQLNLQGLYEHYPEIVTTYRAQNPNPQNFDQFVEKTRAMWLRDPYIAKEDLLKITIPVMLVAGDRDDIRLTHMQELHALIRNSQLCILPDTTHFIFDQYNDTVIIIFLSFLRSA